LLTVIARLKETRTEDYTRWRWRNLLARRYGYICVIRRAKLVLPSFVWMTVACLARKTFASSMREYPAAQELEPGASIHLALDDLEPVDLTLHLPVAPGLGQRGAERFLVTAQARCERRQSTGFRLVQLICRR